MWCELTCDKTFICQQHQLKRSAIIRLYTDNSLHTESGLCLYVAAVWHVIIWHCVMLCWLTTYYCRFNQNHKGYWGDGCGNNCNPHRICISRIAQWNVQPIIVLYRADFCVCNVRNRSGIVGVNQTCDSWQMDRSNYVLANDMFCCRWVNISIYILSYELNLHLQRII